MANDLFKNRTTTFYPHLPALDATPYVPAKPAWRERVSTKVCAVENIPATYESYIVSETITVPVIDYETGEIIRQEKRRVDKVRYRVKTPARQITRCTDEESFIDHPAQPAQPAFPGRAEQFATTLTDFHMGWNAGARSIKAVQTSGYGEFSMPLVTGVIVGLSTDRNSAEVDYATMGHALYFGNGVFKVMERGSEVTGEFPFAAGDRFRIARVMGDVQYIQNGSVIYSSARPSMGAMRLDAAMYSGADEINNPVLMDGVSPEPPEEPTAEGTAEVRAPMAYGGDGTVVAWGRAEVRAQATGRMQANLEAPKYSAGIAMPYAPVASGYVLSGGLIESGPSAFVRPPMAMGATYAYAAGSAELAPLLANGYMEPTVPTPTARLPKFKASGRLTVYQPSRRPIRLPAIRAGGRMGAVAKAKLPKIKAGGALTVTTVMRAELTLPAFGAAFQMSVGPAGQAKLRLPAIRASGAMGAVAKASLPPLRARGAMTVGAAGEARLRLPRIRAQGTLTIGAVLRGTVVLPAIRTARSGMVLRIRLPSMRMVHRAASSGMAAGEAYSTNLRTDIEGGGNEMTRLTNFPFLRVLKFNDWYYGLAADGLYRIEGDRDDGSPIRWEVSTGTTDFGARELKHVPSVYVGGRLGPGAAFTVHEGEKRDASYRYSTPRGQAAQNYRQHFGKGLRARYYSFTLTGESEFELDGLHFELAESKRRL